MARSPLGTATVGSGAVKTGTAETGAGSATASTGTGTLRAGVNESGPVLTRLTCESSAKEDMIRCLGAPATEKHAKVKDAQRRPATPYQKR